MRKQYFLAALALVALFIPIAAMAELKDGELSPPIGNGTGKSPTNSECMIVYVNGQDTNSDSAMATAGRLSEKLGAPVRLCFNDLTLPFIDWFSTMIEKLGDADLSVNAATDTLFAVIRQEIEHGREISLVGHSAGALSIQNAVIAVSEGYAARPEAERQLFLSRIHVLCIGSAVFSSENAFSDDWPTGLGSVYDLRDERDGISNVWGGGSFWDWFDCDFDDDYHSSNRYVRYVTMEMLKVSGKTVIREDVAPTTLPSSSLTPKKTLLSSRPHENRSSRP